MHLWTWRGDWHRVGVTGQLAIADCGDGGVDVGGTAAPALATVAQFTENGMPRAVLIIPPDSGVLLNGYLPLGVAVLEDRDEITVRGRTFYFGARSLPEAMPFPHCDTETRCARCKRPLHEGDTAVTCGACSAVHHQGDLAGSDGQRRECWTYDPACGACGRHRETLVWTPEEFHE
jgi:hypothetical protein